MRRNAIPLICVLMWTQACGNTITDQEQTPSAPSGLSVVAVSSTSARLTWQDNSDNENQFVIYRGTTSNSVSQIAGVGANVATYDDTGLQPATTYYYRVTAANGVGESSHTSASVTTPGEPAIALSTTSLSFTATAGGANPSSQTVSVTNGGTASLVGLAASVTYQSGSNWLSTTLSSTTAPSTLTVQPTTGSLAAGTYTATISISASGVGNSPQNVSVQFTVAEGKRLVLTPSRITFQTAAGAAAPPAQTVAVTASSQSLSGLGVTVTYSGIPSFDFLSAQLNTTTTPATLTLTVKSVPSSSGGFAATVLVSAPGAVNSPDTVYVSLVVQASLVLMPPVVTGNQVQLTWTYTWPALGSSNDAYLLEESTTSATSGFTQIASYSQASGHVSPYTVTLTRTTPRTYWYRVRVRNYIGLTGYSGVQSAVVGSSISKTRFVNNSVYPMVYLKIDNTQLFTASPQGILPNGGAYEVQLSPGQHTFDAYTGFWESATTPFLMYRYSGSFTQPTGATYTLTFNNITIQQLLSNFSAGWCWEGEWWDLNVSPYMFYRGFRFNSNGTFALYNRAYNQGTPCSGTLLTNGTYSLVSYPGNFYVTFSVRYANGASYQGNLDELYGYFYMQNGPAGWPTIQYTKR